MASDVARNFAAAGGMTDVDRVPHVERFDQLREIVGVGVHFVPTPRLARSAMTAAIMCDTAVAVGAQKHHLVLPGVRAQRPSMAEDGGLSLGPVLVIDLRAVLGCDSRRGMFSLWLRHGLTPLCCNSQRAQFGRVARITGRLLLCLLSVRVKPF